MLQFESDFACDISWCVIVLTYVEINCFYFSHLLEKTSDGILKAAKLGDLKTVSGIVNIFYVIVYFCHISVQYSGMPFISLIYLTKMQV